jgi:hypothetical protein
VIEFELVNNLTLKELVDRSTWNLGGDVVIDSNLDRSYQELRCQKVATEYGERYIIHAYDWENKPYLLGIFRGWQTRGTLKYITDQNEQLIIRGRAVQVQIDEAKCNFNTACVGYIN